MRTSVVALIVCLTLCSASSFAQGTAKLSTIQGIVVDIGSYVQYGMKPDTEDRKGIAVASANAGNPLGILEQKTGKIYIVTMNQQNTNPNSTLQPFLGIKIFAKGKIFKRGSVQVILLSDIGKSAT